MAMTDREILGATEASRPDVYAVTAMHIAIGALKTMVTTDNNVGTIIRQLEVAIEKLRSS